MNRNIFLRSTGTLLASTLLPLQNLLAGKSVHQQSKHNFQVPPYLQPGATVGITSPAGYITHEQIRPCITLLKSWGYNTVVGSTIGKRDCTFGGTDAERLADLQQMLDNPAINAIMCARGGYGSVRIVDNINWNAFIQKPKWVIGFSDITVLHNHIHRHCHTATLHSKMCNSFSDNWVQAEPIQVQTISSIHEALAGKKMYYPVEPHVQNKAGEAEGILMGGNLRTIETLAGSTSDINTDGKILFVEDTGEYLYSIDRMFWNLKRTGKLKKLKGLIIGGFNLRAETSGESFGRTVQDIVLELVKEHHYPVCFNFPVGHQRANFALKCGVVHKMVVAENEAYVSEI